jgi:hypothetical protein
MKPKFYIVIWLGALILNLALIVGIMWVAVHFINKFW